MSGQRNKTRSGHAVRNLCPFDSEQRIRSPLCSCAFRSICTRGFSPVSRSLKRVVGTLHRCDPLCLVPGLSLVCLTSLVLVNVVIPSGLADLVLMKARLGVLLILTTVLQRK